MQRTALCLVAALALLAGCSGGVGGGSDVTPTPVESPATPNETVGSTQTPASDTPSGEDGSPTATTRVQNVSLTDSTVLEGTSVAVSATIENRNETTTTQNVSMTVGNTTFPPTEVTLQPGERRTLPLYTVDTSAVEPGEQFVSVSTPNDSAVTRLDVRPEKPLREFIDAVRERAPALQQAKVVGPERVKIGFRTTREYRPLYSDGEADPVPQAIAFEMATNPYAPREVNISLRPGGRDLPSRWYNTLNKSFATKFYEGAVDSKEFRDTLDAGARGSLTETSPRGFDEEFTYLSGARARHAYAEALAERLNNSDRFDMTVQDYGLYNESIDIPSRRSPVQDAIYIKFETERDTSNFRYRNFNSTEPGAKIMETMAQFGNITRYELYGSPPGAVYLIQNDTKNENYWRTHIPHELSIKAEGGGTDGLVDGYLELIEYDLNKIHSPNE